MVVHFDNSAFFMKNLLRAILAILVSFTFINHAPAATKTEDSKVIGSGVVSNDFFGSALAINGNTLVVGALQDKGSAYVFERSLDNPPVWVEKAILSKSNASKFGRAVSIYGDYIAVGDTFQDPITLRRSIGKVSLFERGSSGLGEWKENVTLTDELGIESDFGASVSLHGDYLAVGAPNVIGSVYLYKRSTGGQWQHIKVITSNELGDEFGHAVKIFKNTLVVGAFGDRRNGFQSGTAYVFEKNSGGQNNWGQVTELRPLTVAQEDRFGYSVGISDGLIAIGSDQRNLGNGAVYLYSENAGGQSNWGLVEEINNPAPERFLKFGHSIDLSDNRIIVGAPDNASGFFGATGGSFLFTYQGSTSSLKLELQDSEGDSFDQFGSALAIANDLIVVGARAADENGTGSGSSFIYELPIQVKQPLLSGRNLGSRFEGELTSIQVEFSRLPSIAHLLTDSYVLIDYGEDQLLNSSISSDCVVSLSGDDTRINIHQVYETAENLGVVLNLNSGNSLDIGQYNLTVCPSIKDSKNTSIDGDSNFKPGGIYNFAFDVTKSSDVCIPIKTKSGTVSLICL